MGTGLGARLGGFPRGLGGCVLDDDVLVVMDEVVVVVEVVESEAEERAVGEGGGPWASGAGVGCWVLRAVRTRMRVRALGVCARFPWRPVRAGAGVVALSRLCGHVGTQRMSISAPGRVGAIAGGSRGRGRSIAGCRSCPSP